MGLSNLSQCESKSGELRKLFEAAPTANSRPIGSRKSLSSLI